MKKLEAGTRIFYNGDMANNEGVGTITKEYEDRWGSFYDITLDDGRKINGLSTTSFSKEFKGHGGTRFVTLDAYNAYRRKQFENSPFLKNIKYHATV